MEPLNILVVSSDPSRVTEYLEGNRIDTAAEGEAMLDMVAKNNYHIAVLDNGEDLILPIKAVDPRAEIVLIGNGDMDIIDALNKGVTACIRLPEDALRFKEVVSSIGATIALRKETAILEKQLSEKFTFEGIVGKNPLMLDVISYMKRIAPYFRSVLITGETGTGKEVIASALHSLSPPPQGPFLVCNCGALVETLIESELFGHKKGTFTGAFSDKIGLFEAAGDGVIVLDEIGEMPIAFQPHLLRVLENGEFRRVGSTQVMKSRCKVIALTNRNLDKAVADGKFREDLYFRLKRLTIKLPPVRERMDDLPLLSRHLLERFNKRTGKKIYGLSRPAQSALIRFSWPGNVRELESVIEEAAMVASESFIKLEDLPQYVREHGEPAPLVASPKTLEDIEKSHINEILRQCAGNRTNAAEMLGLTRRSLIRRLAKFDLK